MPKKEVALTKRELDVLKLLFNGYDNNKIAEILHVKRATVKTHRFTIMLKLGVHNLVGLVKYGLKHNLTSLDKDREPSILTSDANNDGLILSMTKEKLLSLTEREKEILTMLADGYTNREVGTILNISHHTVEAHRLNIMLKLEQTHIVDLVKFAIKHQLTSVNKHKSNTKH